MFFLISSTSSVDNSLFLSISMFKDKSSNKKSLEISDSKLFFNIKNHFDIKSSFTFLIFNKFTIKFLVFSLFTVFVISKILLYQEFKEYFSLSKLLKCGK